MLNIPLKPIQIKRCKQAGRFKKIIDGCTYEIIWDYRDDQPKLRDNLSLEDMRDIEEARVRNTGALFV
jgi:hypothetical protein